MKKIFFTFLFLISANFSFCQDVYVNGYVTSMGTYVAPHHRTRPDYTPMNNFSTVGNTNPYTGRAGYIQPTYGTVSTSINLPLVQQVLATRQTSYDTNYKRVSTLINDMRATLQASGLDAQTLQSIKSKFNTYYLEPMYSKNYDFSNNSLTIDIINWLNSGLNSIVDDEIRISKNENTIAKLKETVYTEMASIGGEYITNNVLEGTWNYSTKQFDYSAPDTSKTKVFLNAVKAQLHYYREKNGVWRYFNWKYIGADKDYHKLLDEPNGTMIVISRKADWIVFYDNKVGEIYTKTYAYLNLTAGN